MATNIGSIVYTLNIDTSKIKDNLADVKNKIGSIDKAGQSASNSVNSIGSGIDTSKIATAVAAFVGLDKSIGFVKESLTSFANFESGIAVVGARAGASATELNILKKAAIDLGNDISLPGVSATDAAEAIGSLVKKGYELNDAIKSSRDVLQLARIENIDFAQSADIVADALNSFGLKATESQKIVDGFNNAVNISGAKLPDLALGLSQVGSVAKIAGLSFEETAASLAIMAKNGIKGSDAGTSLKTALLRLSAPTNDASNTMKNLGINIYDSTGKMKPFPDVIDSITKATSGLSEQAKNDALSSIFGQDAIRTGILVLTKGSGQLLEYKKRIEEVGTTSKIAEAQNSGLKGAYDAFSATIETLQLQLGEKLSPAFNKIAKDLTNLTSSNELANFATEFANFAEKAYNSIKALATFVIENRDLIKNILLVGAAFKTASFGLDIYNSALGSIFKAKNQLGNLTTKGSFQIDGVLGLVGSLNKLVKLGPSVSTGMSALTLAFNNPIVAAKGLAAVAGGGLSSAFSTLKSGIGGFITTLGPVGIGLGLIATTAIFGERALLKLDEAFNGVATQAKKYQADTTATFDATMAKMEAFKNIGKNAFDTITNATNQTSDAQKRVKTVTDELAIANSNLDAAAQQYGINSKEYNAVLSDKLKLEIEQKQLLADISTKNLEVAGTVYNLSQNAFALNQVSKDQLGIMLLQLQQRSAEQAALGQSTDKTQALITQVENLIKIKDNKITFSDNSIEAKKRTEELYSVLKTTEGTYNVNINLDTSRATQEANAFQSYIEKINSSLTLTPQNTPFNSPISGTGTLTGHARGTSYFAGGATLVGEKGPEIVSLPKGSKITDANRSSKLLNQPTQQISKVVKQIVVVPYFIEPTQEQLRTIGERIDKAQQQRNSALGVV